MTKTNSQYNSYSMQGSHSLDYKKFEDFSRTFQAPEKIFQEPSRKPAIFKYNNNQQLRAL